MGNHEVLEKARWDLIHWRTTTKLKINFITIFTQNVIFLHPHHSFTKNLPHRGWSSTLIWASVELCQLVKYLSIDRKLSNYWRQHKNIRVLWQLCVLLTALMRCFYLLISYRCQFVCLFKTFFFFHLSWIWAPKLGVPKIGITISNQL